MNIMNFKTIQYISAKNKPLHQFLISRGWNSYAQLFFIDENDCYYMLRQSGNIYKFIPFGDTFTISEISDADLLRWLLQLAKEAIDRNQECLRPTYEAIMRTPKVIELFNC